MNYQMNTLAWIFDQIFMQHLVDDGNLYFEEVSNKILYMPKASSLANSLILLCVFNGNLQGDI